MHHILAVDDNDSILETLEFILSRNKYKVTTLRYSENFEQEVIEIQPNLILMDKNLGWADGSNLCAAIKTNPVTSHIPVILFSAYYNVRTDCMNAGASAFIEKPFDLKGMLASISSVLPAIA